MARATVLLDDLLTFLCFLRSHDIAPVYGRFLPPRAIATLRPLLHDASDLLDPAAQRSERHVDRLRFIHYLCECCNLVAVTGSYLKPTPEASQWIALPAIVRTRVLVSASLMADTEQVRTLWRSYHLPRWQAMRHHAPMPMLVNALMAEPDQFVELNRLAGLLPMQHSETITPPSLDTDLQQLLRYLTWFDMLNRRANRSVRLNRWACSLMDAQPENDSDVNVLPVPNRPSMNSMGGVVVPANTDWRTVYDLSLFAVPVARLPQRRYRLEPTLVQCAVQAGNSVSQIVDFLESTLHASLPVTVIRMLNDWSGACGRIALNQAILLETDTAERLTALTVDKRLHSAFQRRLSPRVAELRVERAPALAAQLKRRGLSPQINLQLGLLSESPTFSRQVLRAFDQPTLAHLYVSARLCYVLTDVIPARVRPPYSVVLDVEKLLTAHGRAVANQLIEDCVQQRQMQATTRKDTDMPAPVTRHLSMLQDAVESGATLMMSYYTPSRAEATWRRIEPIQLDWRNGVAYLIAYCHLNQAERTFRVDRILDLQPAPPKT